MASRTASAALAARHAESFHPHLEFDFPTAIRTGVLHPKLKVAKLCDDRVDLHRDCLAFGKTVDRREGHFNAACFFEFTFRVGDDLSRRVAASHFGRKEAKIRRLPVIKPNSRPSIRNALPSSIP